MPRPNLIVLSFAFLIFLSFGCEGEDTAFQTEDAVEDKDTGGDALEVSEMSEAAEIADASEATDGQNEEEKINSGECVENLSTLTAQEIYEILYNQEIPIAVYLYTDWCHFCGNYAPVFEAVCRQREGSGIKFYKVNPEEAPMEFNLRAYPTTYFFFNDDRPLFNEMGAMSEEDLDAWIEYFLGRIGWTTSDKALTQPPILKCKNCYCLAK